MLVLNGDSEDDNSVAETVSDAGNVLEEVADEDEFVSTKKEPVELVAFNQRESVAMATCESLMRLLVMAIVLTDDS